MHCLKYLNSRTLGCKDLGIRKSELVANTQFLFDIPAGMPAVAQIYIAIYGPFTVI